MPDSPPLVLVDGSSYLYRAFHALPPLTNSAGEQTGAVKGVISMLRRLIKDYPNSPVVMVFDAPGKTFRDELFDQYKAHRPPMPDPLREQVEPIHSIVRAMGVPLLCIEGVEADDVIGTLSHQAAMAGRSVIISTGDKDMAQLVRPGVTLVNTMTNTVMDCEGVRTKFGVPAERVIDLLALMGDKVDNIPGVPGVGEKSAVALLQGLGSLDAIFERLDEVGNLELRGARALTEKLRAGEASARLSRELATIRTDLSLPVDDQALALSEPDAAALRQWFEQLEFRSWLAELDQSSQAAPAPAAAAPEISYEIILEEARFAVWLDRLKTAALFAFDTETTSLDYMSAEVVGVSFAVEPGSAAYLPLAHDYMDAPVQLDREACLAQLKPLLEDPSRAKVGQNLKYDMSVLANHGVELRGIAHDTMLESYVLNATSGRHDMDTLAQQHLNHTTISFESVAGKGAKQLTFNQVALDQAGPYAAEDADITLRLHEALWPQLSAEPDLQRVYQEIELPLIPVLSRIERHGACLDVKVLQKQSTELAERLVALEAQAHELAGQPFNLGSTKQLGEILFDKLQLPVLKKTPKGASSTAEEVLAELALDYPLPKVLIEHRSLAKLRSTYTDKLPHLVNPRTGRLHTSYHQAVTATGRLSSSDPNLQNIPIRTHEGRRIRQAFVAPSGYRILAADYSQIELRIMAHLSGDESLLRAFREGLDVHRATAAEVFEVALDEVSAEQRRRAKAINFGLIYGMSAFGLARQLGLGRNEAQDYIDRYFARYPGVKAYMDRTREQARSRGYVETLFGRRLYLPEINNRNRQRAQAAERTAINAPMQGTAADIIKRAMLTVDQWLADSRIDAAVIMQVHDELVFEVAEPQLEAVRERVTELMSAAASLAVPLLVETGAGYNWDEAH